MSALSRLWGQYELSLSRHPLHTKMATSFTLMSLGDLAAQSIGDSGESWEPSRTLSMALLGLTCHAPYFHYWSCSPRTPLDPTSLSRIFHRYRWLDTRFAGTSLSAIAPKIGLELSTAGGARG